MTTTVVRLAGRDRFTQVANDTVRDERLSWRARGLLVWLLSHDDEWEVSTDQMIRAGREGRDAVLGALRELVAAGYVVRRRWRDSATGQYRFEQTVYGTPQPVEEPETRDGSPRPGFPTPGTPAVKEDQQEHQSGTSRARSAELDLKVERATDAGFDTWWALYPRKVAKKEARRAWNRAIRTAKTNGLGPDASRAMAAITAGLRWWIRYWDEIGQDPEFLPYPATWLNGDRFLESPVATPAARGGRRVPAPPQPRIDRSTGARLAPGVG